MDFTTNFISLPVYFTRLLPCSRGLLLLEPPLDKALLINTFLITIGAFSLLWLVHLVLVDAGIVDLYWGPGFAIIGGLVFFNNAGASTAQLILQAFTLVWSLRLAAHIFWRHRHSKQEDPRYAAMRAKTGATFWWKSLIKIFLLQALLMWLIATPQHIGLAPAKGELEGGALLIYASGCLAYSIGLLFESLADWQLMRFRARTRMKEKTCQEGLWALSRHPNYFGEILLWWGLGLMAFAISASVFAFIGPALLTFLIIKVSGVGLLEQHLVRTRPDYQNYIKTTRCLIPLPLLPWRGKDKT